MAFDRLVLLVIRWGEEVYRHQREGRSLHGEMGKKRPNSFSVKLARMTFATEENESLNPVPVGFFSPQAQVPQTRRITEMSR